MTVARTTQLDLNQPFEFQEAVLSKADRARLEKVFTGHQLFAGETQRVVVEEFVQRDIAIRVRTINNCCDSGASLPSGIPLTRVSIYGSREYQYILGPYSAVKQLMSGVVPDRSSPTMPKTRVSNALRCMDAALNRLGRYIEQVESGTRVQRVYLDSLIPGGEVPGPFGRIVQIWAEDRAYLHEAVSRLEALKLEIPKPPGAPAPPPNWWEEMTPFVARDEDERQADAVMTEARMVIFELENQVFAPG